MNTVEQRVEIKRRATALGFAAMGVTRLDRNPHAAELDRWLADGHAGTMTYLHRQAAKRKDPRRIMPGAKSAVVTLTNYYHGSANPGRQPGDNQHTADRSVDPGGPRLPPGASTPGDNQHTADRSVDPGGPGLPPGASLHGRVAQYAWSADYHDVLGQRLEQLAEAIRLLAPGSKTRCYVDAGPVPERELAQLAGLGWIGKNMMLINPDIGSFTFIGVVLTDADLEPDPPFETDRCGTCTRCLDACPTQAFAGPRDLDARACISYLTIEHRGEFTDKQREQVGEWVFGCDVCQDVCPWNVSFARETRDAGFASLPDVAFPDLAAFATMDEAEFTRRFGDTPFTRPGLEGMRRNAGVA